MFSPAFDCARRWCEEGGAADPDARERVRSQLVDTVFGSTANSSAGAKAPLGTLEWRGVAPWLSAHEASGSTAAAVKQQAKRATAGGGGGAQPAVAKANSSSSSSSSRDSTQATGSQRGGDGPPPTTPIHSAPVAAAVATLSAQSGSKASAPSPSLSYGGDDTVSIVSSATALQIEERLAAAEARAAAAEARAAAVETELRELKVNVESQRAGGTTPTPPAAEEPAAPAAVQATKQGDAQQAEAVEVT